jgi:MFS family permease
MSIGFFGVLYLVALFYQDGLGLSALESGFNTFPEALGVVVGTQLVTRSLYPVLGPRRILAAGSLIAAAMIASLSLIGPGTSSWLIRADMFGVGIGLSGIVITGQAAAFATIAPASLGRASTLYSAQTRLGSAVGVAIMASIVAAVGPTRIADGHVGPHLLAYRAGFLVGAGFLLLGALAAAAISDDDAAPTMVSRKKTPRSQESVTIPASRGQRRLRSTETSEQRMVRPRIRMSDAPRIVHDESGR